MSELLTLRRLINVPLPSHVYKNTVYGVVAASTWVLVFWLLKFAVIFTYLYVILLYFGDFCTGYLGMLMIKYMDLF